MTLKKWYTVCIMCRTYPTKSVFGGYVLLGNRALHELPNCRFETMDVAEKSIAVLKAMDVKSFNKKFNTRIDDIDAINFTILAIWE
jgi:hypothetical protein